MREQMRMLEVQGSFALLRMNSRWWDRWKSGCVSQDTRGVVHV